MPEYTTWNPSDKNASVTLSNDDHTASKASSGWASVRSILGVSSGKYYCEITYDSGSYVMIGVADSDAALDATGFWADTSGYGYHSQTGNKFNSGSNTAYGDSYGTTSTIGIALDMDNGKLWWHKDGVWQASGNPATGANPAYTGLSGTLYLVVALYSSAVTLNAGATAFSYTVPTGFLPGFYLDTSFFFSLNILNNINETFLDSQTLRNGIEISEQQVLKNSIELSEDLNILNSINEVILFHSFLRNGIESHQGLAIRNASELQDETIISNLILTSVFLSLIARNASETQDSQLIVNSIEIGNNIHIGYAKEFNNEILIKNSIETGIFQSLILKNSILAEAFQNLILKNEITENDIIFFQTNILNRILSPPGQVGSGLVFGNFYFDKEYNG